MAGAARVEAARGHLDAAIAAYQDVVQRYPLPQYVVDLVDLQTVAGRSADAASTTGVLHVEEQLFRAAGVDMDLEVALFDADHGVDLPAGLAAARAEWGRRQSITVADALGWALHANGMDAEALPYANRALSLGSRTALFFFHRGEIEMALGRSGAAKRDLATAIGINPGFSILWSARAAEDLRALGGRP
jgi:tetratricopeptide (TPR) repeat protein